MAKRTQTRFIARTIEGAQAAAQIPGFIKPQLATLRTRAPSGDGWLHEVKFDGYRIQAHLNKGRVTLYTRSGLDWTTRFVGIAASFDIPVEHAIFDGEIVVSVDGRPNFSELQADLAEGRQDRFSYYLFDLLYLEGFDLRKSPQVERKRVLKGLFDETKLSSPIFYSEHFEIDGNEMFKHLCEQKMEGLISKKAQAPYRSERGEAWLKIKCVVRDNFAIVGFVEDPAGIAALHLARREGKDLVYVGKVGTGFTRKSSLEIRKKLDAIMSPKSRLVKTPRLKATWVEPKLLAEVEYRDITSEGYLRHSAFKGLK
ncbi:bifunctional non-homologous end joining protein LigD [Nitrobacteraceae bacterium AZCC 2146]